MIIQKKPISMAEAAEYLNKEETIGKEVGVFIKKFTKLSSKKAKELNEKLDGLENLKLREEHIVKMVDLLPKDEGELNKICIGVGLSEDETNKILETIKEYI